MMNSELMTYIDNFISGADTTLETANKIEIMLEDAFPDDDFIEEVVIALACYRPAGPPDTLDEQSIRHFMVQTKRYLENQSRE